MRFAGTGLDVARGNGAGRCLAAVLRADPYIGATPEINQQFLMKWYFCCGSLCCRLAAPGGCACPQLMLPGFELFVTYLQASAKGAVRQRCLAGFKRGNSSGYCLLAYCSWQISAGEHLQPGAAELPAAGGRRLAEGCAGRAAHVCCSLARVCTHKGSSVLCSPARLPAAVAVLLNWEQC